MFSSHLEIFVSQHYVYFHFIIIITINFTVQKGSHLFLLNYNKKHSNNLKSHYCNEILFLIKFGIDSIETLCSTYIQICFGHREK